MVRSAVIDGSAGAGCTSVTIFDTLSHRRGVIRPRRLTLPAL
ncbi:hypothetical protein HSR122_0537 [Halapricum desulfuricans]|uniref:Uncharacterized protein n=1 Tax=Halapricum desulfuricans TaxID=2841257 RepID=A0A897N5T1_9EURY|nr:hypothetical protein HSR122_0537 [Halapricum desulfuricans]